MNEDNSQLAIAVQNFLATGDGDLSKLMQGAFDDLPAYASQNSMQPQQKSGWDKLVQGVSWLVNPVGYSAEVNRLNSERALQYNAMRDSTQFKLQATGQLLQFVQHDKSLKFQADQGELNRNLQDSLANLQRALQKEEGDLNRKSHEKIATLQRKLQSQEGELNREAQAIENERSRALQAYLAKLQQDLQRQEGLLNRE